RRPGLLPRRLPGRGAAAGDHQCDHLPRPAGGVAGMAARGADHRRHRRLRPPPDHAPPMRGASPMGIATYGTNSVDWEARVDLDRLRAERLARLRVELDRSELGALLTFDFHNIRYM